MNILNRILLVATLLWAIPTTASATIYDYNFSGSMFTGSASVTAGPCDLLGNCNVADYSMSITVTNDPLHMDLFSWSPSTNPLDTVLQTSTQTQLASTTELCGQYGCIGSVALTGYPDGSKGNSAQVNIDYSSNSQGEPGTYSVALDTSSASQPVPEPATLALIGLGLVAMGFTRRKRRVNHAV